MTESLLLVGIVIGAAAAAGALFAFTFMLLRRAETGLSALLAAFVASVVLPQAGITLGGIFLTPFDLLSGLFIVVAALRWAGQVLTPLQIVWIGIGALTWASLMLGVQRFGLAEAGNEARATELFSFWACASYFSSFPSYSAATERRGTAILASGAAAIMVAVCVGWGLEMAGYQIGTRYAEEGASAFRVVPSSAAMFLLTAALVLLPRALESESKPLGVLACVLLLQVVLLQHRSVWLAAMLGMTVLAAIYWRNLKRLGPYLPLAVVPAALAGAALLLKGALDGVVDAMSYSVRNEGTLIWRFEGWLSLVTDWRGSGALERLMGAPFGAGFDRYLESARQEVSQSPHNGYLVLLLRAGVLGLVAFLFVYAACVRGLLRARASTGPLGLQPCLIAVLCAQCAFFMFYGLNIVQAMFLGSVLAVCGRNVDVAAAPSKDFAYRGEGLQPDILGRRHP